LAAAHPSEIRADFRSRYSLSFDEVGNTVSWLEAVHLVAMLMRDSRSWLQAAVNNWSQPVSSEWQVLAHLLDSFIAANSKKKQKPLKRPWPDPSETRVGNATRSPAEIRARLERMNPKES
jgi:hypothetical protein